MNKIVRRLAGNAEERLPQPSQRRRLARLVGPVNQVQPLMAARKVKHKVGKRAERGKGKLEDLHGVLGERFDLRGANHHRSECDSHHTASLNDPSPRPCGSRAA